MGDLDGVDSNREWSYVCSQAGLFKGREVLMTHYLGLVHILFSWLSEFREAEDYAQEG